jgi:hypothetical protein
VTESEAHKILDRVKNGLPATIKDITEALIVTGDLQRPSGTLRCDGAESCYIRSRQIYGKAAYERTFGTFSESWKRRQSED